ncbi:MAG: phosphoesterase [bacterium]|nr:phosphoesterase [Gammaproteobacteria bacterium]
MQCNKLANASSPGFLGLSVLVLLVSCSTAERDTEESADDRQWLAGDHHIHGRYSVGWDLTKSPPAPKFGGDAIYTTLTNAEMAKHHGLAWMVTTDHGGPNHSKINAEHAYPELIQSREAVKEVIQFYGLELNTPAGEHTSLIIPHSSDEVDVLRMLESEFDMREVFPYDPSRDTEGKMIDALKVMSKLEKPPVVIVNHPARTARGYAEYGLFDPAELRRWNDTAPDIAVGMAGAPGHQAIALSNAPLIVDRMRLRGGYRGYPTMGGFDQMTAKLGGFWDSMLGEGRRWWITANSDSHRHYTEGGLDFWPGEYSKTYVYSQKSHEAILSGLRAGHVFVTTGDLVDALFVEVSVEGQNPQPSVSIGDEIDVGMAKEVLVAIRFRDPETENANGDNPTVRRVDLIMGGVNGKLADYSVSRNDSAKVVQRFTKKDWRKEGAYLTITHRISLDSMDYLHAAYIRVRGTNTKELEPAEDPPAENPWEDLWFYSNPVFVRSQGSSAID